jgi:hypothetical protein
MPSSLAWSPGVILRLEQLRSGMKMKSLALLIPVLMGILYFGLGPINLEQKLPLALALGVLSVSGVRLLKFR